MELNEKLRSLRQEKGITQDELASKLYVSRTAVSKWESGRGIPNIESLKAISDFFSISIDELLSGSELLDVAQKNGKATRKGFRDLIFGLTDVFACLLLFLPVFAARTEEGISSASLLTLSGVQPYLAVLYYVSVGLSVVMGVMTLALQSFSFAAWEKIKAKASLTLGVASLILFVISLQPYAAVLSFSLLFIKAAVLLKRP